MNFLHLPIRASRLSRTLAAWTAFGGAALMAGCSGSGSDTGNTALIRVVNATAGSSAATVSVNGSAFGGAQNAASASSYLSAAGGSNSFSFTLSANAGVTYTALTQSLATGSYYSLIPVGRADIASPADPRYPSLLVTQDNLNAPPSGLASIRIIDAAPDAGNVSILVNGALIASGVAYKTASIYVNVSAGNAAVQINQTGTGATLVGPQTVGVTAGHVYTVLILEPTISPAPAYSLQLLDDGS